MARRYGSGIGTQLVMWQCSQAAERDERCHTQLAFIFHSVQNPSLSVGPLIFGRVDHCPSSAKLHVAILTDTL